MKGKPMLMTESLRYPSAREVCMFLMKLILTNPVQYCLWMLDDYFIGIIGQVNLKGTNSRSEKKNS